MHPGSRGSWTCIAGVNNNRFAGSEGKREASGLVDAASSRCSLASLAKGRSCGEKTRQPLDNPHCVLVPSGTHREQRETRDEMEG